MALRYLVITADDLGIGSERDRGIIDGFKAGAVTRTSLLVNGVSASTAIQQAKDLNVPLGLHLNLTEGNPVSDRNQIQTLVGPEGLFLGKMGLRDALAKNTVDLSEVKKEMNAQVELFRKHMGRLPQYVDGHHHIHVAPDIREVFASVLASHEISWTRLPKEPVNVDWIEAPRLEFYKTVVEDSVQSKPIFEKHSIRFTNSYVGMTTMGEDMSLDRLMNAFSRDFSLGHPIDGPPPSSSPTVTCELMVHPGYPCRGDGGCGAGSDDFNKSHDRQHELETLTSRELLNFYADNNIKLVAVPP